MWNIKQKMTNFMSGRYGVDHLYIVNLVLYFIGLIVLRRLDRVIIFDFLLLILIFWTFFRFFSKNTVKRQKENQALLRLAAVSKSTVKQLFTRIKHVGTYRYRKCPHCKTTLRLPRKVGVHTVKCPSCEQRFQVKVRI